jgi:predicted N-formylglutamate amidohydrolase
LKKGKKAVPAVQAVVLSCEHGGNRVPARWRARFAGAEAELASHRGWDPGALGIARRMAQRLDAPLLASTFTRLLVDLNRSEGHRELFSEIVRDLSAAEKKLLLEQYWYPYRRALRERVAVDVEAGRRVLHLSFHTFTPVWNGRERDVDVGLLFDKARPKERALCEHWRHRLQEAAPDLRVRFNAPYRGWGDGLTTWLRSEFPADRYLGLELEASQALFDAAGKVASRAVRAIEQSIVDTVREAAGDRPGGG